jgi:2-deoxy-D-gluconate 3-dehydrogenase
MKSLSFDFSGRNVIVTGGSNGIGKATLDLFAESGAVVKDISRTSGTNLFDRDARCGSIPLTGTDILINCAGSQIQSSILDYKECQWDYDIELNLTAMFDTCRYVAPYMMINKWGRIINISSIAGIQGTRNIIGYSVAKAGVIEMTKCMSNEWAPYGITVNCIAPGYIDTDMLRELENDKVRSDQIKGRIPIGEFGKPADVANLILFLCSNEAKYITGQTIAVDGGWLAR